MSRGPFPGRTTDVTLTYRLVTAPGWTSSHHSLCSGACPLPATASSFTFTALLHHCSTLHQAALSYADHAAPAAQLVCAARTCARCPSRSQLSAACALGHSPAIYATDCCRLTACVCPVTIGSTRFSHPCQASLASHCVFECCCRDDCALCLL